MNSKTVRVTMPSANDWPEAGRDEACDYGHCPAEHKSGRCHANKIWPRQDWKPQLRFRPRWRLATPGTLRLGIRGACGGT